jgi:addiction module HigA family antidote
MLIRTLARRMSVPVLHVTEIVEGTRSISPDLALRLGAALGTGPRIWRSMQLAHELATRTLRRDA